MQSDVAAAIPLLSPDPVRARSRMLYEAGLDGRLLHFRVHPEKLAALADYVVDTIRKNYPTLEIPFHARWRHFVSGGQDRWAEIDQKRNWTNKSQRGRAAYDLAITSVLLDAGAGPDWRFTDPMTGLVSTRSEGLGIASLRMFEAGAFSADPSDPLRADAARLATVTADDIARGFQVSNSNPLVGLEGRASLLRSLGQSVLHLRSMGQKITYEIDRPGWRFDYFCDVQTSTLAPNGLPAKFIAIDIIQAFQQIWPSRLSLGGIPLGDCWRHPLITTGDASEGLIPFHKLSQWMTYSLIEPLQWAGVRVVDIDGLTGLPEYRNGGLFLDGGVISLKDEKDAAIAHEPGSTLVVEWRALTVALLDEIAVHVRRGLGMTAEELPLAKILEGGTWSAGRRIAREKRAGGGPPLSIISDGTVF